MKTFKCAFLLILGLVAGSAFGATKPGLKWDSFGFDLDTKSGYIFFYADADGKVQEQDGKKHKIQAELTLPVFMQLTITGRNPLAGSDLKDIFPLIASGVKAPTDVTALFGKYMAKMSTLEVLLGQEAVL